MLSVLDISYTDEFDFQDESTDKLQSLKISAERDSNLVQKYERIYCCLFIVYFPSFSISVHFM